MSENKNSLDSEAEVVQEMKQVMSTVDTLTASADVLLPLLIFTIVKSNPTNFLSNLKFIQRYRRHITGQESYCLTNMVRYIHGI
jgi:hypothetical protein